MAEVRAAASGEILAKLTGSGLETATTREVKAILAGLGPHVSRFRMQLLRNGKILAEEELPFSENDCMEMVVDCIFVSRRGPTEKEAGMLIRALGNYNDMAIEMLLMKGIHPEFLIEDERHRLHNILSVAIEKEWHQGLGSRYFPKLTEMLIEGNGNVNLAGSLGRTPLFVASELGWDRAVSLLLKHRAHPDPKESLSGERPLHVAVRRGDVAIARLLLDAGADAHARRLNDGFTAGENAQELAEANGVVDMIALFPSIVDQC
eukprot:s1010_g12.t1